MTNSTQSEAELESPIDEMTDFSKDNLSALDLLDKRIADGWTIRIDDLDLTEIKGRNILWLRPSQAYGDVRELEGRIAELSETDNAWKKGANVGGWVLNRLSTLRTELSKKEKVS